MTDQFHVAFVAGAEGPWRIDSVTPIAGESLPAPARLAVKEGGEAVCTDPAKSQFTSGTVSQAAWVLRGLIQDFGEDAIPGRQTPGGQHRAATQAVLIPMRKSAGWRDRSPHQRRGGLCESLWRMTAGLNFPSGGAVRLADCQGEGVFDVLTWIEFTAAQTAAVDAILGRLRDTEDWSFVEREVEIRLSR